MTTPVFGPDGFDTELNIRKMIADVAVEQGVQYIIFSTLPSLKRTSGGKYTNAVMFQAKYAIGQHIRGLAIKSAFVSLGQFMENFHAFAIGAPRRQDDGTWIFARRHDPTAKSPLVATRADTGKFIGAILADPENHEGKTFHAATALYSQQDIANVMS